MSHKKFRDARSLFVAEGPKIVNELAMLAPDHVEKIYATPDWLHAQPQIPEKAVEINEVELERISGLQTPNQVLGVFRKFQQLRPGYDRFVVYLDTVQDPGNFGTILRTADWFGVERLVCSPGCADLYNSKVVQATMASIGRVMVFYDEDASWIAQAPGPVFAAVLDGDPVAAARTAMEKRKGGVLLIGNESKGISDKLLTHATHRLTIPRKGEAESLNAAVAAGILLYHLTS